MKQVQLPFKDAKIGDKGDLALEFKEGETEAALIHVCRPASGGTTTVITRRIDAASLRKAARLFTEVADELDSTKENHVKSDVWEAP